VLLRDSQVLPIWEGTTNVLVLDTLRALRTYDADPSHGLRRFDVAVMNCVAGVNDAMLVNVVRSALDHTASWLAEAKDEELEGGARRFALTLGRTIELALLIKHECLSSAARFANLGIHLIFNRGLDR
jgi:hypothetical protein